MTIPGPRETSNRAALGRRESGLCEIEKSKHKYRCLIRRKPLKSIRAEKRTNRSNGDGWATWQDFVEPKGSNKSSLCNSPLLGLSSQEIPVPLSPYTAMLETSLYRSLCLLLSSLVLGTGGKPEKSISNGLRNACRAVSIKARYWADMSC